MEENENNIEAQNEGQFIRLFNNVRRNTELNSKSKMILSHIISYQLQGKEFFMSNERIGYEHGFSTATAARAIKKLMPYLNKRKEYVQKNAGEQVVTIRYLSVKDLSKWVQASVQASNVITQNEVIPNPIIENKVEPSMVKPLPSTNKFISTTTIDEFLDLTKVYFKNDDDIQSFVAQNGLVYNHLKKLHSNHI